jgi:hypothetical protein
MLLLLLVQVLASTTNNMYSIQRSIVPAAQAQHTMFRGSCLYFKIRR